MRKKTFFKIKQKPFFILFKGLPLKQIKQFSLTGKSPTLIRIINERTSIKIFETVLNTALDNAWNTQEDVALSNQYITVYGRKKGIYSLFLDSFIVGIYLFKANNGNTRTMYKICLKLTIKTPDRCHWCSPGVFIIIFGYTSQIILVFLFVHFEKVNAGERS